MSDNVFKHNSFSKKERRTLLRKLLFFYRTLAAVICLLGYICRWLVVKKREQARRKLVQLWRSVRKHVRNIIPSELDFNAREKRRKERFPRFSYFWRTFEQRDDNYPGGGQNGPFEVDRFDPKSIIVQRSINF